MNTWVDVNGPTTFSACGKRKRLFEVMTIEKGSWRRCRPRVSAKTVSTREDGETFKEAALPHSVFHWLVVRRRVSGIRRKQVWLCALAGGTATNLAGGGSLSHFFVQWFRSSLYLVVAFCLSSSSTEARKLILVSGGEEPGFW